MEFHSASRLTIGYKFFQQSVELVIQILCFGYSCILHQSAITVLCILARRIGIVQREQAVAAPFPFKSQAYRFEYKAGNRTLHTEDFRIVHPFEMLLRNYLLLHKI